MKKILVATVVLALNSGSAQAKWQFDTTENAFKETNAATTVFATSKNYQASAFVMCQDGKIEVRIVTPYKTTGDEAATLEVLTRADKGAIRRHMAEVTSNTAEKVMLVLNDVTSVELQEFADARNNIAFGLSESTENSWTFGAAGSSRIAEVANACHGSQENGSKGEWINGVWVKQ